MIVVTNRWDDSWEVRDRLCAAAITPGGGYRPILNMSNRGERVRRDSARGSSLDVHASPSEPSSVLRVREREHSQWRSKHSRTRKLKGVLARSVPNRSRRCDASAYDDLIENNRRRMTLLEEAARLLYGSGSCDCGFRITNCASAIGCPRLDAPSARRSRRREPETLGSSFQGEIEYVDISAVTPDRIGETSRYDFADAADPRIAAWCATATSILVVRPPQPPLARGDLESRTIVIVSTGFAVLAPESIRLHISTRQRRRMRSFANSAKDRARGGGVSRRRRARFSRNQKSSFRRRHGCAHSTTSSIRCSPSSRRHFPNPKTSRRARPAAAAADERGDRGVKACVARSTPLWNPCPG